MKKLVLILLLIFSLPIAFGLAEERLKLNVITNIDIDDLVDEDGNSRFSSVVVGYDAALTDYQATANLAVFLTSINKQQTHVSLSCDSETEILLFTPAQREVHFRTNLDPQTYKRVLIGGPFSNDAVKQYDLLDLLKKSGDVVVNKYGTDLVIAGYTGFDTQRAVDYVKDLIKSKGSPLK